MEVFIDADLVNEAINNKNLPGHQHGVGGSGFRIDSVAENPTRINPMLLGKRGYCTADKDVYMSNRHWMSLGEMPESKTFKMNPYNRLPPIDANRSRNQKSTVFEPEVWTLGGKEPKGGAGGQEGERPAQLLPPELKSEETEKRPKKPENVKDRHPTDEKQYSDEEHLLALIPKAVYLPAAPLKLSKDDEWKLLRVLSRALTTHSPELLKDVYLEMTSFDRSLSGWCSFQDLSFVLSKKQFYIPQDLLRLVACIFISPEKPTGHVNYEKMLSLFGTVLKMNNKRLDNVQPPLQKEEINQKPLVTSSTHLEDCKPKYYNATKFHTPRELFKSDSPLPNQEFAKLLRTVVNRLQESNYLIDFHRVSAGFQHADREHRETLSASQIKEVCYNCGMPLQEWIIDQILITCCDGSSGQYNWNKFLTFLERVQPTHTGLRIPSSKMPLEYAKNYPSPLPNWPKATDTPRETPAPEKSPLWKQEESSRLASPDKISEKDLDNKEDSNTGRQRQLNELERNREKMRESTASRVDEDDQASGLWFENFMKLANALYKHDINHTGYLPLEEVRRLVYTFNDTFNLNISSQKIEMAIADARNKRDIGLHKLLNILLR